MPIQAQSADGTIHEFPDGTPDAVIDRVMKSAVAPQQAPAAAPQSDPTIKQQLSTSLPVRIGRGMMEPVVGGIQAMAHLVNSPESGFIDDRLKAGEQMYQADRKATGQEGTDFGRIAGNIASPVNYAIPELGPLRALPYVGRLAEGALTGAALGGLQPVHDGNFADEKAKQVEIGAAGGAIVPTIGGLMKGGGKLVPHLLGGSTGTSAEAVRGAYQAGKAGGEAADAFTGSMRGDTPWQSIVSDAKDALGNMRAQRNAQYRSGMADISKDQAVLDFKPVDEALSNASNVKTFKGQDLSPKTAEVRGEIQKTIDEWKSLDPNEYHTPEGFDALKQKLGDIRDALPFNTPQRVVADQAYNAVRKTIADQAPAYNKVMADYSKASEEISNIQRELSLGPKGNPGTALRKLQSIMRNNANTSWGARADAGSTLADAGATNLIPALAGQSLSAKLPRGLARVYDAPVAALAAHSNPLTLLAAPLASPRAVGELAYGAGQTARGATALANLPVIRALPRLRPGSLGAGLPGLVNPSIYGAQ